MFPPEFDYYRANSVEEALELLTTHAADNPAVLAGGHGLVPALKTGRPTPGVAARGAGTHTRGAPGRSDGRRATAPGVLVDISAVDELDGIRIDETSGSIHVGPLVTHAALATDDQLRTNAPALADAAREVGDIQVRNRGTIGGNLADADPAADLPPAILAAEATLHLRGPAGARSIPATEFFRDAHQTALDDGELLVDIELPISGADDREGVGGYVRKTHPATGYAVVGVAAVLSVQTDVISTAKIAATGVQSHPTRLSGVENALTGATVSDTTAIERAADQAGDALDESALLGDPYASARYRRQLLGPHVHRAVTAALRERGDGTAGSDGRNTDRRDGGDG